MRHRWQASRTTSGLAAAVVVTVTATALTGAPAAAAPDRADPAGTTAGTTSVTLVTGDRVLLGGPRPTIEPGPGRRVGFRQYTEGGELYVVPTDAVALVAAGRVDRRLFNVTRLVAHGYDDRNRPELPLVVTRAGGRPPATALPGTRTAQSLSGLGGSAVRAKRADTAALWRSVRGADAGQLAAGIKRISLDGPVRAALATSVPQIGAPTAWSSGLTGKGATVAVLDMGVDTTHPDLKAAVVESRDFSGSGHTGDGWVGHGTHVASIIAGSGAASGAGAVHKGVAPDARLLNGKVLDNQGFGTESAVIAGIEWAAERGAKVVNISLGFDWPGAEDPVAAAVDRAAARGVLAVVAAGNDGEQGARTVRATPASADAALTVGAVDRQNRVAAFSSRGPRFTDDGVKPEITAPGVAIDAANPVTGQHRDDGEYHVLSGTSMAAPHVAGVAALLAGAHPDWSAQRLKAVLVGTALPTSGATVFEQGAGRVDAARAARQQVFAGTAVLNQGTVPWPRTDDVPMPRTVTYTNIGAAPVTLDLSVDARNQQGGPAPAGLFTLGASSVTVPAGGSADVVLTTDTRTVPDGIYGGVLVAASAAGDSVRIPLSVHAEATERHNLNLRMIGSDGAPTQRYSLRLVDLATHESRQLYGRSGTGVERLPRGRYALEVALVLEGAGVDRYDVQIAGIEPEVLLDRDVAFTFDARLGRDVALTVDRPGVRQGTGVLSYRTMPTTGPWETGFFIAYGGLANVKLLPSVTRATEPFVVQAETAYARPAPDGTFTDSPYVYNLRAVVADGTVPAGITRSYTDSDLASVTAVYHAPVDPAKRGSVRNLVTVSLPATVTEYYTPDMDWDGEFTQYTGRSADQRITTAPRRFHRGVNPTEHWNTAVVAPAFHHDATGATSAAQWNTNQLAVNVRTHGDGVFRHTGDASHLTSEMTLWRNGERVAGPPQSAGTGAWMLPADPATYRLVFTAVRDAVRNPLSTSVRTEWSFTSAPPTGGAGRHVPLLLPRFLPDVDTFNRAPAGTSFVVPVQVQKNGAAEPVTGGITVGVEASYDDGASWAPATVTRQDDRFLATVDHPATGGFVSLRARVSEAGGTTVTETVLRAYALKTGG